MYVYMCVYIYIYIYTYVHTYIHTYIHMYVGGAVRELFDRRMRTTDCRARAGFFTGVKAAGDSDLCDGASGVTVTMILTLIIIVIVTMMLMLVLLLFFIFLLLTNDRLPSAFTLLRASSMLNLQGKEGDHLFELAWARASHFLAVDSLRCKRGKSSLQVRFPHALETAQLRSSRQRYRVELTLPKAPISGPHD